MQLQAFRVLRLPAAVGLKLLNHVLDRYEARTDQRPEIAWDPAIADPTYVLTLPGALDFDFDLNAFLESLPGHEAAWVLEPTLDDE